jgi:hypothetical protein
MVVATTNDAEVAQKGPANTGPTRPMIAACFSSCLRETKHPSLSATVEQHSCNDGIAQNLALFAEAAI